MSFARFELVRRGSFQEFHEAFAKIGTYVAREDSQHGRDLLRVRAQSYQRPSSHQANTHVFIVVQNVDHVRDDLLSRRVISGPGTYLEKPVNPLTYVRSVQRALGIEETEELESNVTLREKLQDRIRKADPEALRKALKALQERGEE